MEELICREGTVHSVIFQNAENGYTVLRLLTEEGEVVTVVGCIPCVAPGEHLTVTGTWEVHPQHGEQLKAQELERTLPEEEEEIFAYLSSGVSRAWAPPPPGGLWSGSAGDPGHFRGGAGAASPVRGITAQKARRSRELFRQHMGLRRLMEFLSRYRAAAGAGHPAAAAVWGRGAPERWRKIPICCRTMCAAWTSPSRTNGLGMGMAADSDERLQAAVTFELSHNENNGHVFLPRNKLIAATVQLLDCPANWWSRRWTASSTGGPWSRSRWPMWRPATSGGCGRRSSPPASGWRGCWKWTRTQPVPGGPWR